MNPVDEIAELFASEGAQDYLGEPLTIAEHMCQAGALAREAGADDALVATALLHDVGHFHGAVSGRDLMSGTDNPARRQWRELVGAVVRPGGL